MKAIVTQRVTMQIGESDFDTSTEVLTLDASEPISKILEWTAKRNYPVHCVGHLELQFKEE